MNALNRVWSDTYTLQIISQERIDKLTKIFLKNLILKK